MKEVVFIIIIILAFITGCSGSDNCEVGRTRCNSDKVEICNSSNNWSVSDDCKFLSGLNNVDLICYPATQNPDSGSELEPASCLPNSDTMKDSGSDN